MYAIVTGLNHSQVLRLKETWKDIPAKILSDWNKINDFACVHKEFKAYKHFLKLLFSQEKEPNILPHLRVYLEEIASVETKDDIGSVNLKKMTLLTQVVTQIKIAQNSTFEFPKQQQILNYLVYGIKVCDADTIVKLSKKCE